jgi:hypothetical protein
LRHDPTRIRAVPAIAGIERAEGASHRPEDAGRTGDKMMTKTPMCAVLVAVLSASLPSCAGDEGEREDPECLVRYYSDLPFLARPILEIGTPETYDDGFDSIEWKASDSYDCIADLTGAGGRWLCQFTCPVDVIVVRAQWPGEECSETVVEIGPENQHEADDPELPEVLEADVKCTDCNRVPDGFACDFTCFAGSRLCDGVVDCETGEDEDNC